jgi:hypothetical protein
MLTINHLGFDKTRERVEAQIFDSGDKFRVEIVKATPIFKRLQVGFAADVEFQVKAAQAKLRKRLERQNGLSGKYVAH